MFETIYSLSFNKTSHDNKIVIRKVHLKCYNLKNKVISSSVTIVTPGLMLQRGEWLQ